MDSNREEAQDLAQDAFIRAFKSLHTFDTSRSFPAWLFRITTNLCVDHYRRKKLDTVSLTIEGDGEREERTRDLESPEPAPDEEYAGKSESERLERMIRALPAAYRIVILLRHQSDMSYEEVAEALNLPIGTVKARIHRAHKMLKEKIERWGS